MRSAESGRVDFTCWAAWRREVKGNEGGVEAGTKLGRPTTAEAFVGRSMIASRPGGAGGWGM